MFYQLVGIANASFYDSQIRSSNQSSLEPTYDKTQVDIRFFNILYCTSKRKTPPSPPLPHGYGSALYRPSTPTPPCGVGGGWWWWWKKLYMYVLKQSHPGCHIIFTDPQPTQSQERKGGGPSGNLGGFFWRF